MKVSEFQNLMQIELSNFLEDEGTTIRRYPRTATLPKDFEEWHTRFLAHLTAKKLLKKET